MSGSDRSAEDVDVQMDSPHAILEALEGFKRDLIGEFRKNFHPHYTDIEDPVLRGVVEKIAKRTQGLAKQARSEDHVDLTLDDLFEVVTDLIPEAGTIEAVDLEIDRWANDDRAQIYAERNRAAVEAGAKIRRVYVISPNVTVRMMDVIEATLIHHLEFNDRGAVVLRGGRMSIGVLHYEDMSTLGPPRDFAIFDNTRVLFETFNEDWTSTFHGQLTQDEKVRIDHSAYFDQTWRSSQKLLSADDVRTWANQMRTRIAEGAFRTDVFVGYAEAASLTGKELIDFLRKYQYTVFDWQEHIEPGRNVLEEIKAAREECKLGLFLFTGEDMSASGTLTPRDNVVLEYGYFLGGKPGERVIAVIEEGIEEPSDIAGTKWISLAEGGDVKSISDDLRNWLEDQIGSRPRRRR